MKQWIWCVGAGLALSCGMMMAQSPTPPRDINAVLRAHDRELLALKGVTGVYVGLTGEEKRPCLTVMLKESSPETERALPRAIEGYPIVVRISGEIRPLSSPKP